MRNAWDTAQNMAEQVVSDPLPWYLYTIVYGFFFGLGVATGYWIWGNWVNGAP